MLDKLIALAKKQQCILDYMQHEENQDAQNKLHTMYADNLVEIVKLQTRALVMNNVRPIGDINIDEKLMATPLPLPVVDIPTLNRQSAQKN